MNKTILITMLIVGMANVWLLGLDRRAELEWEIGKLKHEICCWNLLQTLQLTKQQVRHIAQIAQQVKQLLDNYRGIEALHLVEFENALQEFLREDMANQGLSPQVERRAGRLSHQEKNMKKDFCARINKYERKVARILTPDQLLIVENYQPRFAFKSRNKRNKKRERVIRFLKKIRTMPDYAYANVALEFIERHQNRSRHKAKPVDYNRIWPILEEVRRMSAQQFQQNLEAILVKLQQQPRRLRQQQELQRIRRETRGYIGNIGKYLLFPQCMVYYEKLLDS